ncbi:MAG: hypothetical protein JST26_04930 [Bacteroidetes bacterium]|nr:hypothetical protein [Bacteroidota bacterium]
MSKITFNINNNTLTILKGDNFEIKAKKNSKEISTKNLPPYLKMFQLPPGGSEIEISLENFYNESELKGIKAETAFKEYLRQKQIPSLRIGQGLDVVENDEIIKGSLAKRPDFLVTIPELGTVFFDVKSRVKISNPLNNEVSFYISYSEIEKLYNLRKTLLIPVWIVFVDTKALEEKNPENIDFYACPINQIFDYCSELNVFLKTEGHSLQTVLIPDKILLNLEKGFYLNNIKIDHEIELYKKIHLNRLQYIAEKVDELFKINNGSVSLQQIKDFVNSNPKKGKIAIMYHEYPDYITKNKEIQQVAHDHYLNGKIFWDFVNNG